MTRMLGVDVGGTFSDFVRWDGEALETGKVSSTPDDQSVGVMKGAEALAPIDRLLHGTTVATNALLEQRGAKTALVTSAGFGDVIEIGRQDRPSLYDSFDDRPPTLVAPELRFEVPEGTEWEPPPELDAAQAVAVSLLYGYQRAEAEQALVRSLAAALGPDVPIAASSDVVPEFREYERSLTTVLNAYLAPEAGRYLQRLAARCRRAGLPEDVVVMRSSGGLIPIAAAERLPAAILLSGPAGGVMAAAALGRSMGRASLVSFDMGGTSTDVCRIEDGEPDVSYERTIAGYPCRLPAVAVHTVGAGGGSVAWADSGGALRVGPRSSGADPGPAAYGRGGREPAVTDANVVLGRIPADAVLAGGLELRADLAERAIARLGSALGLDVAATAQGIAVVVEEVMAGAIRKVSIEQGADPRRATLVAFGGAGGLHATALARSLGMAGVLVPLHAGVFSALGLLLSPPRVDLAQSVLLQAANDVALDREVEGVATAAAERLRREVGDAPATMDVTIDVRYLGQAHEVSVPYARGDGWSHLARHFHRLHHERNGFARPDDPIEVVTVRAAATGRPVLDIADLPFPAPSGEIVMGVRPVHVASGLVDANVVARRALPPGAEVIGPAIIEEAEATTYLGPGERALVHDSGALEIEW